MKFISSFIILLTLDCLVHTAQGEDILFLAPVGTKSHKNSFMPLIEGLAAKGHKITHVTHVKAKKLPPGVTEVVVEEMAPIFKALTDGEVIGKEHDTVFGLFHLFQLVGQVCANSCDVLLNHKFTNDILSGKIKRPDIIISSLIFNDCNLALIHKLGVPFIYESSGGFIPWTSSNIRNPEDSTYCPQVMSDFTDRMDFGQRLSNTLMTTMIQLIRRFIILPPIQEVVNKNLGADFPSLLEIERNYSLILLNTHFSYDYPRPLLPGIIEIGGMHVRDAKPLPEDLEKFVAGSKDDGIIYFSLGSAVSGSSMDEKFRKIFVEAFSKVKQRVLWKWETDYMPGLSPNVRISKWLPQQDILGHPKLRLFITHGGLLSTMETTHHGVPVIGIPIAADQKSNMKKTEKEGAGIMLSWDTLSVDTLLEAINKILTDPMYRERVTKRAAITRDRDMHPRDKGVYWVEYVMRHGGAYHLQPGSLYLSDFAYYKLDMFILFHIIFFMFIIINYFVFKWLYGKCCKSSSSGSKKQKKKKKE